MSNFLAGAVGFARNYAKMGGAKTDLSAAQNVRDYPLGSSGFPAGYDTYGADPADFAPEFYGEYLRTSNLVYSVVKQRASWLASLPLRLYKYTSGGSSKTMLPRMGQEELAMLIIDALKHGKRREPKTSVANITSIIYSARSSPELHYKIRGLGMEEVFSGPVHEIIQTVNPFWTFNRLTQMTSMCLDIWGQSYIVVNRGESGTGNPTEMWWVKPTQMRVIVDPVNYILGYMYMPVGGGEEIYFKSSEVVRIYHPNPIDEFQPLPPLASARIYADHETSSMQSNINLQNQGLHPGAIVMPDSDRIIWEESQAREIERDINRRLGGVGNAHKWGTFRHKVNIDRSSITPKDAEYIAGMSYDAEAIARTYDWPIDLLSGKRTYENVEQAFRRAWQSVMIQAAFITAELAEQLFTMFSNPGADVPMYDGSGVAVLQESEATRWATEKEQIDVVITRNQWRQARGMEPLPGGDALFVSNQMTPLDNPSFITGQPDDKKDEGAENTTQIDQSDDTQEVLE